MRSFFHFGALALLGVAISSCASVQPPTAPGVAPASAHTAIAAVAIKNYKFVPGTIKIAAGTKVRFTNDDGVSHTVTSNTMSFNSGFIYKHHAWQHVFTKPGKYPYHCQIHPYMKGTVVVTK